MRKILSRIWMLIVGPKKQETAPSPLANCTLLVPKGISLQACEAGTVETVLAREESLYYPLWKCIVPKSAEVIIAYSKHRASAAEHFANVLRAKGWSTVVVEPLAIEHEYEHGDLVG